MAGEREPEEGGGIPPHEGAGLVRGGAEPGEPTPEEATRVRRDYDEDRVAEGGGVPNVDATDIP